MKTGDDFKKQAEKHNITEWPMRGCSICDYQLSYIFKGDDVLFDSGCDCTSGGPNLRRRTWNDVAEHYNMQTHPEAIKKYDEFWHFETTNADV